MIRNRNVANDAQIADHKLNIGGLATGAKKLYVGTDATQAYELAATRVEASDLFTTIDAAIGACVASRGDIIFVLPGHAETVTASITCDIAGVSIIGLGNGKLRPALTCNAAIDAITVTAANVSIYNLYFLASTLASVTARINVGAANCKIDGCLFLCGQHDLETITVADAGDDLTVENCEWRVTANGPDAAIEVEANGVDGLQVLSCHFNGGDDTNAWDAGAINSGVTHTGCLIKDNTFLFGPAIIFSSTAKGLIQGNVMGEGTLGSMLDPGSCMCALNYESDTVDESGSLFPQATPVGGGISTDVAAILADTGTDGVVLDADSITAAKIGDDAYSEEHFDVDSSMKFILGEVVDKAATTLPQTTATAQFTVAGGRVLVTSIVGEVTVVIETQANNTKLVANPTTGTSVDMCAVLDITAGEAGCLYGITGTPADALVGTNAGLTIGMASGIVINAGTIDLDCAASNTGETKWTLHYIPIDVGATVVAA